jgi:hypothetical protein
MKLCLQPLKERHSFKVLANKFVFHRYQIYAQIREFIELFEIFFEKLSLDHIKDNKIKLIEILYTLIGELTIANDFLKYKV